jgi:hypothetical protein
MHCAFTSKAEGMLLSGRLLAGPEASCTYKLSDILSIKTARLYQIKSNGDSKGQHRISGRQLLLVRAKRQQLGVSYVPRRLPLSLSLQN